MPSFPGGVGLMLGMPWDNKPVCVPWAFGLQALHPPMNYDVRWCLIRGKPVDEARTEIMEAAMKEKCRYLMFVGTDVSGPAFGVRQLIWHMENFRQQKFLVGGGIYVNKGQPQMPMVFRGNGQGPYMDWKVGEVFEVSGIGMDYTLIDVETFSKLNIPKPWFKTVDSVEAWKDNVMKVEHWTEDLFFCKKVTDAGYRIFADGGILCSHWDSLTAVEYQMPPQSKPFRGYNVPKGTKKIADMGSGTLADSYKTEEGVVVRVDIREDVSPDWRCDLRQTPFKTGEFDVVYSSNTLEHFDRSEWPKALDEWVRVLSQEGELRLVLPNLEWAAQKILNGEVDGSVMDAIYGKQSYPENQHKMGWTPQMLEQALAQRGFKRFEWVGNKRNDPQIMVRAWRQAKEEPKDEVDTRNSSSAVDAGSDRPGTVHQLSIVGANDNRNDDKLADVKPNESIREVRDVGHEPSVQVANDGSGHNGDSYDHGIELVDRVLLQNHGDGQS